MRVGFTAKGTIDESVAANLVTYLNALSLYFEFDYSS